jgi:hypothetical protein
MHVVSIILWPEAGFVWHKIVPEASYLHRDEQGAHEKSGFSVPRSARAFFWELRQLPLHHPTHPVYERS